MHSQPQPPARAADLFDEGVGFEPLELDDEERAEIHDDPTADTDDGLSLTSSLVDCTDIFADEDAIDANRAAEIEDEPESDHGEFEEEEPATTTGRRKRKGVLPVPVILPCAN